MTRDVILRMARSAFDVHTDERGRETFSGDHWCIEEFAALVAAHEREMCARVCDEVIRDLYIVDGDASEEVYRCAKAIRARGEEPKRHPDYIIGDHWLQAAYTRVCTGETVDEVMADYGWRRVE